MAPVVSFGAAIIKRIVPKIAPIKYGRRKADSRERKWLAMVTTPPPRNMPIGIEPQAKNR